MFHDKRGGFKKPSKHVRACANATRDERRAGRAHEHVLEKARFAELKDSLQRHGDRNMCPLEADLLSIAAAVSHADRVEIRHNTRWERNLRLICSVNVPDVWREPLCQQALGRCLGALSYDRWEFEFRSATAQTLGPTDGAKFKFSDPKILLPFSDGLDSLATYELIRTQGLEAPIALTVRTSPGIGKCIEKRGQRPDPWAFVKVLLGAGKHAETSTRSRSFLFLAVAMVLARLCDVKQILIPETGQGAIGAALTPFGEPSAWGSHPYFTRLFVRFVDLIPWTGRSACIEHPNLWGTKAELLTKLAAAVHDQRTLNDMVRSSFSCANPKRSPGVKKRRHCGICPNCLLRRVALFNGGFSELHHDEEYIWKDLGAPNLVESVNARLRVFPVTHRHEQIARSAVIAHRDLAALADHPGDSRLREQARLIAEALGLSVEHAATHLQHLLERHQAEWERFLAAEVAPDSWVRTLCG